MIALILSAMRHASETYHGVSIHEYHLGLLTPIVLSWMLAVALGRLLGMAVVLVAVVAVACFTATDPFLGLVALLWLVFAVLGWRAPAVVGWLLRRWVV